MQNQNIIISIGGNIKSEDGSHPIQVAEKAINCFKDYSITVMKRSKWYESDPIPKSDQPNFFNCIIFANTTLVELDVLKKLHEIEYLLGRERKLINEARVIDLDLIDYENKIVKSREIIVPHPRAHLRRFVMEPLAELDENWVHPIFNQNVNEILKKLNNQDVKAVNKNIIIKNELKTQSFNK